jgi:MazG family protein
VRGIDPAILGVMTGKTYTFDDLRAIMARLRAPDGCPWDREQTHQSIKECLLEETYEFLEAVEDENAPHMREELGDLLLQVVFHAQMGSEVGEFDLDGVIQELSEKLVRRHPHVFGETEVSGSDEVSANWETIKNSEVGKDDRKSRMDGIPHTFPALLRAKKMQVRAARDGFDWPSAEPVWEKLDEEIREVREAIAEGDAGHLEEEVGDLLFVAVNLARKLGVDPEIALQRANAKFDRRYRTMESIVEGRSQTLSELDLASQDLLWEGAKAAERLAASGPSAA